MFIILVWIWGSENKVVYINYWWMNWILKLKKKNDDEFKKLFLNDYVIDYYM